MKFSKAHHFIFAFDTYIGKNLKLKIEPYYQSLFDIPVVKDSSFSIINMERDHGFNEKLVNDGTGTNYGIDITFERFLSNGFYFLTTGSLFESKYKGGDNKKRNTRHNRNYTCNFVGGKEWTTMKNQIIGINGKLTFMGGRHYTPVDKAMTIFHQNVVYLNDNFFSKQYPATYRFDFTINYRINKPKYSSVLSLQIVNVLGSKDQLGEKYNIVENNVQMKETMFLFPVLNYKIEF